MNKILSGIFCFVAVCTFTLTAQTSRDSNKKDSTSVLNHQLTAAAVGYLQTLSGPVSEFNQANYNYLQAVTRSRRPRAIERKRQDILKVLRSEKEYYSKCSPFNNDTTLKTEIIRYLDLEYAVLKEDFDKIVDMEEIAAKSYDQDEAYQLALDLAFEKLKSYHQVVKNAEAQFCKRYNIILKEEKTELALKIEKSNKALEYYDGINRIFYKANKENAYASISMAAKDIAGLEQHATTLVAFADEGLKKLKEKKDYDGDYGLISSATRLLQFYIKEGDTTYRANIDFHLKADNFQRAVKKFNAIKEKDRKKEDIDQYNQAVDIYNKGAEEINKINKKSDKFHNELIDDWNKQVQLFFEKHT